jgi:hypothetical protein
VAEQTAQSRAMAAIFADHAPTLKQAGLCQLRAE